MTQQMKRSWLVQRLIKPRNYGQLDPNTFSFGGGYKNGGLSEEAMSLLRPVMSFDYMGAAEFEFGALPKALNVVAEAAHKRHLSAFSFEVPFSEVEPDWRNKENPPDGSATIYALCRRDHVGEVESRIRSWAAKDHTMKESTRLPRTLWPATEYDGETVGWLELDNGFLFFTDREMWAQTCELFGVKVEAVTR